MEGTVWGRACRGFLLTALLLAGCTLPEVRTAQVIGTFLISAGNRP
jgi:hypothetical protein